MSNNKHGTRYLDHDTLIHQRLQKTPIPALDSVSIDNNMKNGTTKRKLQTTVDIVNQALRVIEGTTTTSSSSDKPSSYPRESTSTKVSRRVPRRSTIGGTSSSLTVGTTTSLQKVDHLVTNHSSLHSVEDDSLVLERQDVNDCTNFLGPATTKDSLPQKDVLTHLKAALPKSTVSHRVRRDHKRDRREAIRKELENRPADTIPSLFANSGGKPPKKVSSSSPSLGSHLSKPCISIDQHLDWDPFSISSSSFPSNLSACDTTATSTSGTSSSTTATATTSTKTTMTPAAGWQIREQYKTKTSIKPIASRRGSMGGDSRLTVRQRGSLGEASVQSLPPYSPTASCSVSSTIQDSPTNNKSSRGGQGRNGTYIIHRKEIEQRVSVRRNRRGNVMDSMKSFLDNHDDQDDHHHHHLRHQQYTTPTSSSKDEGFRKAPMCPTEGMLEVTKDGRARVVFELGHVDSAYVPTNLRL